MDTNIRELFQVMSRRLGLLDKNCCSTGGTDISLTQSHILYEIDHQNQPSIQQVADTLGLDITTASRQIQTLVAENLVVKSVFDEDRRVVILKLTPEGKFVTGLIDTQMSNYLDEVFGRMSDFERDTVIRSIQLFNDSMSKSISCCHPVR